MKQFITDTVEKAGSVCARLAGSRMICLFASMGHTFRRGAWRGRLAFLGKASNIYSTVRIMHPDMVAIGSHVNIADFVHIWGAGGVTIGDDCLIASHTIITSQTHDAGVALYRESMIVKPVVIGKNVWIGAGSILLPGIQVGDNAIIGAGSVVVGDVPSGATVVGVPARITKYHRGAVSV